jgi:hypothetical protein
MAAIINRGDERRRDHWPNAWQLGEPPAIFVCPANSGQLAVELVEPEIEAAEFIERADEELTCEIRQFGASDGVARLHQKTPRALRQNNSILANKSPHMIDKGCPGADDAVPGAVKRLKILLSGRFDRHEPHCWARGGFVNSFGIRRVVLDPLTNGFTKRGLISRIR